MYSLLPGVVKAYQGQGGGCAGIFIRTNIYSKASIVWNPAGMEKEERRGGSAFLGLNFKD